MDGTKGDFVFRDFANGEEYISIMFEMKNEADETKTKKKNEDFLEKLDKDRRKKGCEYAILVSMLESENELYNKGIVNMSHRYEKMYVVHPQFFVPIITLLTQAAKKNVEYMLELKPHANKVSTLQTSRISLLTSRTSLAETTAWLARSSKQPSLRSISLSTTFRRLKALCSVQRTTCVWRTTKPKS